MTESAHALDTATPPGWTQAFRTPELVAFYKETPQAHARALLAIGEFDAPPEAVFNLVADVASFVKFVPYLKESRVIDRLSPDELIGYQRISAPLTEDRDTYFRVRLSRGSLANGGVFKDEWAAVPAYRPENKGVIRMQVSEGSWTLEPIADGRRTRATYTVLSNPGGAIPKWIVDMSGRTAITGLFKALRDQLRK
jgi:hypothetical protein